MLEFFKRHLCRQGPGETLLSRERLDNIDDCIASIMRAKIPGDLVECGVWKGGACMLMRALLEEYGDTTRNVWVVDSFQGCPRVDPVHYPVDGTIPHDVEGMCAVSLEVVRENFQKYSLEDGQVRYLPGWFKDTLPTCEIGTIALLRIDGDLYESTWQALEHLYDRVSPFGWVIDDDYGHGPWSKAAVDAFRKKRGIKDPLYRTRDATACFWQKDSQGETLPHLKIVTEVDTP